MKEETVEMADSVIANTYARFPVVFEKGEGCTLWDSQGNKYTDFLAGIAVCNLGHAHPAVSTALKNQAETLVHVSNLFYTRPQVELAEWLTKRCFADKLFFANSGAEANEAAIKVARKYFHDRGEAGRNKIITMAQSFHGRTMATLTATGQDKIKEGFSPVLPGFEYVPYNDIEALTSAMDDTVCAVMMEPVQGEGGICCADADYIRQVRELCDKTGTILIFDEIQTGIGRTGKLFAHEHFDVTPDIMTLAKALGNGLPIGAMLATDQVMKAFGPGTHGSTFGGTPLVTAVALAAMRFMEDQKIVEQGAETGAYFWKRLSELKEKHASIKDVRGLGLLLGIKIDREGAPIVGECLKRGYVINCVQGDILRFIPPLVISKGEIDGLIEVLDELLAG